MNRIATVAVAAVLAAGAAIGAWRAAVPGPQYAEVVRATPVTVREPRYAEVVEVVPLVTGNPRRPRVLGYDVAYREGNRVARMRLRHNPGDQVGLGARERVIGYDVAWRWRDRTGVVRLPEPPGKRLPVVGGAVAEQRRPALAAAPD